MSTTTPTRESPQGGVLSPLLANVYLSEMDRAQASQKEFIGRLTRYADDFVIQCGTRQDAERALEWSREQLARLGLQLHPEKTRVVADREGFDFLGFHHRRVPLRLQQGRESYGVLRWPGRKACRRFREKVRGLVGPPGRLQNHCSKCLTDLRKYLVGWCQYYRHGESVGVFAELDAFVAERIARNRARSQPKRRGRRRRTSQWCLERLRSWKQLPTLIEIAGPPSVPIAVRRTFDGEPCEGEPHARFGGSRWKHDLSNPWQVRVTVRQRPTLLPAEPIDIRLVSIRGATSGH